MKRSKTWIDALTPVLLAGILALLAYGQLHEPRFEYRTRLVGDSEKDSAQGLERELDALGADGWEVVSFDTVQWTDDWHPTTARVCLRRRK